MFDKLKEECGIFGVIGHPEAARLTYLGLYALQHRGQESAGIVSSDGERLHADRGMDHVREGAIFSSTSDTEVVLHKIARSRAESLVDAVVETFRDVDGAYSMLFLTPTHLIVVRDPRGFRPLAMGALDGAWVFASETCAF